MNIKTNILFFVKNTISKVKTIKQGHHLAICYEQYHNSKPKQLQIWTKNYNFL